MTAPIEFYTPWRTSSYSSEQVNCVEVALGTWRKGSFSGEQVNCVEVAFGAGVRDSKNPGGGHLALDAGAYQRLVTFARQSIMD